MHTFKAALRIFISHPIYICIYLLWLSSMGVFMGLSVTNVTVGEYVEERPTVSIIDRDRSELSLGISAFIGDHASMVELEDSERALQDAVMQEQADYIAIIPDGFEASFLEDDATNRMSIETIIGPAAVGGSMMDNLVNEYLSIASAHIAADPQASGSEIAERTGAAMGEEAEITVVNLVEDAPVSSQYLLFLRFSSYTITLSIAILCGTVLMRFRNLNISRRSVVSAVPALRMNLELGAACFVITLLCWAFVAALGLIAFGSTLEDVSSSAIVMANVDMLVYGLFGLALGFLMGQVTRNETVMNAVPNLVGLVCSFLGGVWFSLDYASGPVLTLAKFTPSYYYDQALTLAFESTSGGLSPDIFANMGMVLLFAIAIFAIGLAVSRLSASTKGAKRTSKAAAQTAS